MALAKTGNGIISITGKMAGNVFKQDASGQHVQSRPRLVKKTSLKQAIQRKYFSEACQFCMKHLGL